MEKFPNGNEEMIDNTFHALSLEEIHREKGEIERVVKSVLHIEPGDKNFDLTVKEIATAILNGTFEKISDEDWSRLENTESYHHVAENDLATAQKYAEQYKKNYGGILKAIKEKESLPSPIILDYGTGLHLIAGNTRLMIMRALGKKPYVTIAKYSLSH